ncbi:MAG: hypothetical protein JWL61_2125 [Gemmatimonadetes bacterium]|nr:hypothetical protein [Gemmatimonadota bacterium]
MARCLVGRFTLRVGVSLGANASLGTSSTLLRITVAE